MCICPEMCIVGNLCWSKRLSHSLTSGGCELEKSLMCSLARDSTAVLLCSYRDSPTVYHCTHIKPRLSGVFMCSFGEFISGDTLSRLQHFGFFRNVQLLKILPESSPRKDTITSCVFPRETLLGTEKKSYLYSFHLKGIMVWGDWLRNVHIHGCCSREKWKGKSVSSSTRLVPSFCWESVMVWGGLEPLSGSCAKRFPLLW